MATWGHMSMLDSNSPIMEQLNFFHDHTLMVLLMITILVGYNMTSLFWYKTTNLQVMAGQYMEVLWTLVPTSILVLVAFPSLRLLYLLEEVNRPCLTIKAMGHQWYWSYEYSDFKTMVEFDSYMIPSSNMESNSFRLLDVDNRTVLPTESHIRMLVTSLDVLHSWTVPALGIKTDATPGRLNQLHIYMNRSGLFFGQCSEICGVNHSFMPIVIESIPTDKFYYWVCSKNNNNW